MGSSLAFCAPVSPLTYSTELTFGLVATGGDGSSPVVFGSSTPNVCRVNGNVVSVLLPGICALTADQAGDNLYAAAATATASVTINLAGATISGFAPPSPLTFTTGLSFVLSARGGGASSPIRFGSQTPVICTVSGNMVTVVLTGTCTVTADQAGDATHLPAQTVTANVVINRAGQTITMATIPAHRLGDAEIAVAATTTSALPVAFVSITPVVCAAINSNTIALYTIGTCTITADQPGNSYYSAATQVTRSFVVNTVQRALYLVHADHLGTPRAVTRASDNQVVWKWDNTDPFGANARASVGSDSIEIMATHRPRARRWLLTPKHGVMSFKIANCRSSHRDATCNTPQALSPWSSVNVSLFGRCGVAVSATVQTTAASPARRGGYQCGGKNGRLSVRR